MAIVIDWNIVEPNSRVNINTKKTELLDKNKYINKTTKIIPKAHTYNKQFNKTAIIPNKYTSIRLPTNIDTEIKALRLINTIINPIVKIIKLKYEINGINKKENK